ncbi:MAG: recombinase family protein [Candidatus Pacebacteria bacterium]|nr:recombinase family protein [Candidatus Paceibacterota bacterium]
MSTSQKFFLYARKSTDVEDKQVLSIDAQIAELREYAKRENIEIVCEFIEKQSAKIPGRPIFNDMLSKLEKGVANAILAWHPDRLARNSVDGGQIVYLLDTGRLATLKFPSFWFESTPQGKFMLSIAFGQSKYYVDSLSENTKRGLRQKVRRGEFPSRVPIGYLNDSRTKTIVLEKIKAPIVRECFETFATGKFTIENMRDFLAKKGVFSKYGKRIHQERVAYMLSNPFYYGHFKFTGEIYEGTHEPLISKKLFDDVQAIMRGRHPRHTKTKVMKPFLGLLRCGKCGMMITAEVQKGHTYYRCTKKSPANKCPEGYVREENLDIQLSGLIKKYSLREDWASEMEIRLEAEEKTLAQSARAFVQEKRVQIKVIEGKLERLLNSYLDQILEQVEYVRKKAVLMSEKKSLQEEITLLEQRHGAWLEPFRKWIGDARNMDRIARDCDLFEKKVAAEKIFGSNLLLTAKIARGSALVLYSTLASTQENGCMEPKSGIEPETSSFTCTSISPESL